MTGAREPPPSTGSPWRRWCSSTSRDRRRGSLRGMGAVGLTRISTRPAVVTPSMPKPSRRQRLRNLASLSRPLRRGERRAASHTSSPAAARSTPCSTSSRLKVSFSSPITTTGGSSPLSATRSQPPTSPLAAKPRPSRKLFTGRYSAVSRTLLLRDFVHRRRRKSRPAHSSGLSRAERLRKHRVRGACRRSNPWRVQAIPRRRPMSLPTT